jgi:hypothetical protein
VPVPVRVRIMTAVCASIATGSGLESCWDAISVLQSCGPCPCCQKRGQPSIDPDSWSPAGQCPDVSRAGTWYRAAPAIAPCTGLFCLEISICRCLRGVRCHKHSMDVMHCSPYTKPYARVTPPKSKLAAANECVESVT